MVSGNGDYSAEGSFGAVYVRLPPSAGPAGATPPNMDAMFRAECTVLSPKSIFVRAGAPTAQYVARLGSRDEWG